jgi:hypothetical protein
MRFTQLLRFPILRYTDAALTDCGKASSRAESVTSGAKARLKTMRLLKRFATQNQMQHRVSPQPSKETSPGIRSYQYG